jgi:hypothetical protein
MAVVRLNPLVRTWVYIKGGHSTQAEHDFEHALLFLQPPDARSDQVWSAPLHRTQDHSRYPAGVTLGRQAQNQDHQAPVRPAWQVHPEPARLIPTRSRPSNAPFQNPIGQGTGPAASKPNQNNQNSTQTQVCQLLHKQNAMLVWDILRRGGRSDHRLRAWIARAADREMKDFSIWLK